MRVAQFRADLIWRLFLLAEKLEDALGRRQPGLQQVQLAGELCDRHRELARVLDEGLHVAEGDGTGRHPVAADCRDHDIVDVAEERHRRHDDAAQELRPKAGLVERLVLLVELRNRLLTAAENLHQRVPRVHLLDLAVERAGACPLGGEMFLRPAGDQQRDDDRERDRDQGDHGEQGADPDHDG